MAEHDSLGQARRATTVGERYQVFPSGFNARGRRRWMGAQQVAEGQRVGWEHLLARTNSNDMF